MITDPQVRKLLKYLKQGKTLAAAAARSGMDEKTGRKYRTLKKLPSDIKAERSRSWQTRHDPLGEVWQSAVQFLEINAGLEAKALFTYLQHENPGLVGGSQLRTFQRRVRSWRAKGNQRHEVFFPRRNSPGKMSRASFRDFSTLKVRVAGRPFDHLVYHFILTWSNWETCTICRTEDFTTLSKGLHRGFQDIGGVTRNHITDGLSATADKVENPREFLHKYHDMLDHYRALPRTRQQATPAIRTAVEQRYRHLETVIEQALLLRGSREFKSLTAYEVWLRKIVHQLNRHRLPLLREEQSALRPLPRLIWRNGG